MSLELRDAFRFFLENAGYATPPGRAACALDLARAEQDAELMGFSFEWVSDDDPDLSWMTPEELAQDHESLGCIVRNASGTSVGSLWGIIDPDADYRRVIEAELASEALAPSQSHMEQRGGK